MLYPKWIWHNEQIKIPLATLGVLPYSIYENNFLILFNNNKNNFTTLKKRRWSDVSYSVCFGA